MKTQLRRILPVWFLLAVIVVASMTLKFDGESASFASILVSETSVLLAAVTFLLSRLEMRKKIQATFLNFSLFFLMSGTTYPLFKLINTELFHGDAWLVFFVSEYQSMLYYLMLPIAVIYLVLERIFQNVRIHQIYLAAFLIAGGVWVLVFGPYVIDPKYSYATSEIRDFRAIRTALNKLRGDGIETPTVAQISSIVEIEWSQRPYVGATDGTLEARIKEILPFLRGDDVGLLIMRPFWWSCFWMSLLCIPFIILCIVHQFRTDPPGGAYLEKMVCILLVYCLFEVLHNYAYTEVTESSKLMEIKNLGYYVTSIVMFSFLFLLTLRIRFVLSIEGRYYERALLSDASRVTRWRDAFDNWVLRQFMNAAELEQRFLIRQKEKTTKDDANDRSKCDT
jgi:hypothetical protein